VNSTVESLASESGTGPGAGAYPAYPHNAAHIIQQSTGLQYGHYSNLDVVLLGPDDIPGLL